MQLKSGLYKYLMVKLTVHVDGLAQLNQFHFSRHVAHRSHQVPQVFTGDEAIFVFIKLYEGFF